MYIYIYIYIYRPTGSGRPRDRRGEGQRAGSPSSEILTMMIRLNIEIRLVNDEIM